ncbi:DJ-1/PfpI family protein [Fictibacillus iocasae]|uniref:DJ-1/PfpI family protein n=1 Tax=Fictibacillus iocasae TaxID=2715437 RepID=A0ABW2NHJ7_9BACL
MKKRVLVYLYPLFREVEIMTALSILSKRYEILPFSLLPGTVTSECGLQVQPLMKLKNINPRDYELLIIPGGKQANAQNHPRLMHVIQMFDKENIRIAAIGNGTVILGRAGVLLNRQYTASLSDEEALKAANYMNGRQINKAFIEDRKILTAKSHAYIDFGLVLGDRLQCFSGLDEYNFYKGTSSF